MNEPESGFTPEDPPPTRGDKPVKVQKVQRTRGTRKGRLGGGAPNIGFGQAISLGFRNYFNFSGRATRAEFWFFRLFLGIINFSADLIEGPQDITLTLIVFATLIIPDLSSQVRRLHDLNKSGWWLLLHFAVCIGSLVLLVWFCTEGTRGKNDYGPPRSETI